MRLDSVNRDLESITAAHAQTLKTVGDMNTAVAVSRQQIDELNRWKADLGPIADLKSEMALFRRDIEELRKSRDEWVRRIWAMTGPLLGAVVGAILGYYLRK